MASAQNCAKTELAGREDMVEMDVSERVSDVLGVSGGEGGSSCRWLLSVYEDGVGDIVLSFSVSGDGWL